MQPTIASIHPLVDRRNTLTVLRDQALAAGHSRDGRAWRYATPAAARRLQQHGTPPALALATVLACQALHQFTARRADELLPQVVADLVGAPQVAAYLDAQRQSQP